MESLFEFIDQEESIQTDYLVREKELKVLIEKEFELLPPSMQNIFIMSRFGYLTHKEIASQLKISEHTVKTQIKRALKILK